MLSPIQKEIVEQSGNLIVRASAGTGKTHTMVSKIVYDIEHQHSHKVIAAITFTIKAANEIKERLTIDTRDHFIGTNNSFAIEEVIKPFMKDVYGKDYKVDMSTDYSVKVDSFTDGVAKVKKDQLLCSYSNNKENFIFQLALDIVKKSSACQLYLQAKYFKIYVDEYQDCDKDMHEFFMYLCDNLNIDTFVVGDEKQSIYIWRGAHPQSFMSIWEKENFSKKFMRDNFRSCKQIQNYSNLLCKETRDLYSPASDLSPVIMVCATQKNWVSSILSYIDDDRKCALLRYSKANAELCAEELTNAGLDFTYIPQTPIADITTESAWIYNAVAKYFIVPTYSAYDFRNEIPNEIVGNKRIINYIKQVFANLDECIKGNDPDKFTKQIEIMAEYFGYTTKPEHCQRLYTTISDTKYHPAFSVDRLQRIAITFHSSKGLEFDQVILFVSDYRLSNEQEIYNHYVAATRAKTKLIMVYIHGDWVAEQFVRNINRIMAESSLKITDVATIVSR
ncbi:MAG: ATP-dependent helicase [Enterocloster citroniae]|nr:ATP-dependent helicase [Enterocloster citroniae]